MSQQQPEQQLDFASGDLDLLGQRSAFNATVRDATRNAWASKLPGDDEYTVIDHQVAVEGSEILVRAVVPTPKNELERFPLLFWTHGGGWFAGDLDSNDYPLRMLSHELRLAVFNVDYRLAPEHRHPTQVNDSYAALKWAAANTDLLRADLKRGFIVAGESSGAHIAAVLVQRSRDDPFFKDYPITGQLLQIPPLLHPDAADRVSEKLRVRLRSYEENKNAATLTSESMRFYWSLLLAENNPHSASDPEVSPFLHPNLRGLPPAVIQIAEADPLRDEAILYGELLAEAGGKARVIMYLGVPHGFSTFFPEHEQSVKLEFDVRQGLRWLLDGAP
uniref:Alpha/beta hydrolase fold-3 domain-containing protein n=1 Tax=Mycena chlorophos TaxID=658473 RepID=A0ABQ0LH61_MYCCL|nr:predicted protein [Mycena chlorophos]